MTIPNIQTPEPNAVDNVRRVREQIDREHGSDLQGHVDEITRIAAAFRSKFKIRPVPASKAGSERSGTHA